MTVSEQLLKRYIRLALAEVNLARVPQQLLSPGQEEEHRDEDEGETGVDEISGVGAIAGHSVPLGTDPVGPGRQKNRRR